jgi:hypothetical protein
VKLIPVGYSGSRFQNYGVEYACGEEKERYK